MNASYISSSMLMTSEKPQRLAARVVGVPSNGENVCIIYVNVYVYKQKAYKRSSKWWTALGLLNTVGDRYLEKHLRVCVSFT